MKKTLIFALICVAVLSCKKDQSPIKEGNPTGLLSKILISGKPYQEFTYTSFGLISEVKSWGIYSKYTYNSENKLEREDHYVDPSIFSSSSSVIAEASKRKEWANSVNVPKSVTNTYSYPKTGQFIERLVDRANGTKDNVKYELNEKGLVSKETFYNEGNLAGYVDYSYDDLGNLTLKMQYFVSAEGKNKLSSKTEYEFDNKKNPYFPFSKLILPGQNTNRNNITKETYTAYGATTSIVEWLNVTNYTYEYNNLDYPVKVDGETVYEYY